MSGIRGIPLVIGLGLLGPVGIGGSGPCVFLGGAVVLNLGVGLFVGFVIVILLFFIQFAFLGGFGSEHVRIKTYFMPVKQKNNKRFK